MTSGFGKEEILQNAKNLVEQHGKKSIDIVQQRINNLENKYSRESDYIFMLLSEVEKLLKNNLPTN